MAKAALKLVFLAISDIAWYPWRNYGRHELKNDSIELRRKLAVELAHSGWMATQPLEVVKTGPDDLGKAQAFFEGIWKVLKALTVAEKYPVDGKMVEVPAAIHLMAFEKRYVVKDKIVIPTYDGVYAFQRGGVLDMANALLLQQGKPMLETIPCYVMDYHDEAARIQSCGEENYGKDFLANKVTGHWPTNIKAGKALFDAKKGLCTEGDFTDLFKIRGLAQKAYAIIVLDARFPQLGIVDKIVNAGSVVDGKVTHDIGNEYGASLLNTKVMEFEQGTRPDAKPDKVSNPEDIKDYFTNPAARTVAVQPLGPKAIATLSGVSPSYVIRAVLACIKNGKTAPDNLAKLASVLLEENAKMESLGFTKDGKPTVV